MATPFDTATEPVIAVGITAGQTSYLRDLMLKKATLLGKTADEVAEGLETWLTGLSKVYASQMIDRTLDVIAELERNDGAKANIVQSHRYGNDPDLPSADVVPEGRYAIATDAGAVNALAFYKIDRPTEGRWAGYVFVKLLVSDVEKRLGRAASATILAKIAEVGAEVASRTYGREACKCGICGRGLTNDESRKRGIGPDCAERMGW